MEAIARVIDPACFNGKVPPEGRQPCSTGDRNSDTGVRLCIVSVIVDVDMRGWLRALHGSVQLRGGMMMSRS